MLIKYINYKCICGISLRKKSDTLSIILPCEHLFHTSCLRIYPFRCPICNSYVSQIFNDNDIKNILKYSQKPKFLQIYYDMISVYPIESFGNLSGKKLTNKVQNMIYACLTLNKLNNVGSGIELCNTVFKTLNLSITIKNKDNILEKSPVVYIANHSTHLDGLIMFYIFKCGFAVSTHVSQTSWVGKKFTELIPHVLVQKGQNTVLKIKHFLTQHNKICIFPEGIYSHPDTLINFRTGAFHLDTPIQPVIIKYDTFFHSNDYLQYVYTLLSQTKINVTVNILPPFYPPFDMNSIRNIMANYGSLHLSRVSTK